MRVAKMLTEKIIFIFIFCSQAFIKELFMRSKRTCFCFFKTVTVTTVTQKNHFWKLLYCYIVTLEVSSTAHRLIGI